MEISKYYIINHENLVVENIGLFYEKDAEKLKLKRCPIETEQGTVTIGWIYLPLEDRFLPPAVDLSVLYEQKLNTIRQQRNTLLFESDIWVMPDLWSTYNQDEQNAWREYRQKLRDLPSNITDIDFIVWPEKPIVEQTLNIKPSEPIDPQV